MASTLAGIGLIGGFGCALMAALHPALLSVWPTSGGELVERIADGRRGPWQLANWLFGVGMAFTLTGLAGLSRLLPGALASVALVLASVASALWIAALAFRLTTTVRVVDSMADGGSPPDWYLPVQSWADHSLMCAAGLLGGLGTVLHGAAAVRGDVFAGWTGWFAVGCGVLLIAEFALTRDVIPGLLYLGPLPLGIDALA